MPKKLIDFSPRLRASIPTAQASPSPPQPPSPAPRPLRVDPQGLARVEQRRPTPAVNPTQNLSTEASDPTSPTPSNEDNRNLENLRVNLDSCEYSMNLIRSGELSPAQREEYWQSARIDLVHARGSLADYDNRSPGGRGPDLFLINDEPYTRAEIVTHITRLEGELQQLRPHSI